MTDRLYRRPPRVGSLVTLLVVALVVGACGAAASPAPTTPATPTPTTFVSPVPSAAPGGAISQDEAVARVLAQDPAFAGIGRADPSLIGQSAWYEVSPASAGWRVVVTKGWGDCQAGCISRHTWTYDVDDAGTVTLVSQGGEPLPAASGGAGSGGLPAEPTVAIPSVGGPWIAGRAVAGPTCPVVRNPPDPSCADHPVAGALIVVRDGSGALVATATTRADGTFLVAVRGGGSYTVLASPVEGLMGTPAALVVAVPDGPAAWGEARLSYDTGIR